LGKEPPITGTTGCNASLSQAHMYSAPRTPQARQQLEPWPPGGEFMRSILLTYYCTIIEDTKIVVVVVVVVSIPTHELFC